MNIEQQVISLDLAKRLKELDVKQESYFYHHEYQKNRDYDDFHYYIKNEKPEEFDDNKWKLRVYSAFTVSELGEMLPKGGWHQESTNGGTRVWAVDKEYPQKDIAYTWDEKEADGRAKMLIYLIESGLMKVQE